jgi:peptidoglycan biosynthesis protein MviN/MurJ (putative lipid II flippase)
MGFCVAAGAGTGLKGTGAVRQSLRAAVVTSIIYVLFSLTGAVTGGTGGAVLGAAVAMWCGALVYWWQFFVALRQSGKPVSRLAVPGRRLAVKLRK